MRESWDAAELRLSPNRRHRSRPKILTPLGKATLLFIILVCSGLIVLIAN
jgi:hypothetical protein